MPFVFSVFVAAPSLLGDRDMPHGAFYSQVVIPSEARNLSLNHRTHKKRAGDKSRLVHAARFKYSKEKTAQKRTFAQKIATFFQNDETNRA